MRKIVFAGCVLSCYLLLFIPSMQSIQIASVNQAVNEQIDQLVSQQMVMLNDPNTSDQTDLYSIIESILLSIDTILPSIVLIFLTFFERLYNNLGFLSHTFMFTVFEFLMVLLFCCYIASEIIPIEKCLSRANTMCNMISNLHPVLKNPLSFIILFFSIIEPLIFTFFSLTPLISFLVFPYLTGSLIQLIIILISLLLLSVPISPLLQVSYIWLFFVPSVGQIFSTYKTPLALGSIS